MVERAHRQMKDSLKARMAGPAWPDHLPWVLLGLRAAPKEDSGISSAELVLGAPLVLPGQLLDAPEPPATVFLEHVRSPLLLPPTRPLKQNPPAAPTALLQAQFVYIRRGGSTPPLVPPYTGPYAVISRGEKTFTLQVGDTAETVSVDRLFRSGRSL